VQGDGMKFGIATTIIKRTREIAFKIVKY
jgi:hypothetical protein